MRGLVLNARSALEPENLHGAAIWAYQQAGVIRMRLAQSVMELHHETLGGPSTAPKASLVNHKFLWVNRDFFSFQFKKTIRPVS